MEKINKIRNSYNYYILQMQSPYIYVYNTRSIQLHIVHTIALALYSNPRKYSLLILLSQPHAKINTIIICPITIFCIEIVMYFFALHIFKW